MTDTVSHAGRQAEALEAIAAAIAEAGRAYQSSVTEALNGITAAVASATATPGWVEHDFAAATPATPEADAWRHKAIRRNLGMARLERERDEARAQIERVRALAKEMRAEAAKVAPMAGRAVGLWDAAAAIDRALETNENEGA